MIACLLSNLGAWGDYTLEKECLAVLIILFGPWSAIASLFNNIA